MSLVIQREDGQPIHIPAKAGVFEFDAEVAQIFENMAQRSIPMYPEVHRLHASLLRPFIQLPSRGITIWDIGASTGRWFRVLREVLHVPNLAMVGGLRCYALDNSQPMLDKIAADFVEVTTTLFDLTSPVQTAPAPDIVVMFYVLQFLPKEEKRKALTWLYQTMAFGGKLVLGQKEAMMDGSNDMFQSEYIKFRLANGYTQEEIDAKTIALKGSMWLQSPQELREMLFEIGFKSVYETTRWLNFSTVMATK